MELKQTFRNVYILSCPFETRINLTMLNKKNKYPENTIRGLKKNDITR